MNGCKGTNKFTGRRCGDVVVNGLDRCIKHARRIDLNRLITKLRDENSFLDYKVRKLEQRLAYINQEEAKLIADIKKHL